MIFTQSVKTTNKLQLLIAYNRNAYDKNVLCEPDQTQQFFLMRSHQSAKINFFKKFKKKSLKKSSIVCT